MLKSGQCHFVNVTAEFLCHSGHCDPQDWFKGWCKCWMCLRWSCLDLWKAAGHRIQSLQQIPLLFFTDNPRNVVLCPIHPLFMGIPQQICQWKPHYNFLSQHFAYHCCCHWGESLAKTHFIHHQHSWHIRIPNPPPHNAPYGPSLVRQTVGSGQVWNWILVACNMVICWLANRMGIQQPDHLIKTLVFKFVVDCIENSIQHSTGIVWIENPVTILHLLLNLPGTFVCVLFILNDLFQLLRCKLGRWVHIPVLLEFLVMLGISETSNHWDKYIWMGYNQFYSFNQNLH